MRDIIAWKLTNLVLGTVATKWYRNHVNAFLWFGLLRATEESGESPDKMKSYWLVNKKMKQQVLSGLLDEDEVILWGDGSVSTGADGGTTYIMEDIEVPKEV